MPLSLARSAGVRPRHRRWKFALILTFVSSSTFALGGGQRWQWSASFTAGGYDSSHNFIGGTEVRRFASWNATSTTYSSSPTSGPKLFAANGYPKDSPGPEGQQNSQVPRLDGPESLGYTWQQDVSFGGSFCPTRTPCASTTWALAALAFTADIDGNAVNTTIIEAATLWEGDAASICSGGKVPVYTFFAQSKRRLWYQNNILCHTGSAVRSYGAHVDQVTGADYAFAGIDGEGIWKGQLRTDLTAGEDPIVWATGSRNKEFATATYGGPSCTVAPRIMAFAEATGADGVLRLYATVCHQIFIRIDGPQSTCTSQQVYLGGSCQSRWALYWTDPAPAANSGSGFGGLTEVNYSGSSTLLVGGEGNVVPQYRLVPYGTSGCNVLPTTCYIIEYDNVVQYETNTGIKLSVIVSPYNEWTPWYDRVGSVRYAGGQNTELANSQSLTLPANFTYEYLAKTVTDNNFETRIIAEGYLLWRYNATDYNLTVMPDNLFSTPLEAVRDVAVSPFWSECAIVATRDGCAIYVAGYDVLGSSYYYWCKGNPCPAAGSIPWQGQHNTAWIARFGRQ